MIESTGDAGAPNPRRHGLIAKLLFVLGGILIALLVVELALRIAGFTYFNPYTVDQDVGTALRPGAEGWWKKEGRTYVKINSQGFRDREHMIAKPPGTFRIAVLGDSFAEALQVRPEQAFWSVMESQLPQCPRLQGNKVEVLNFGVSGFSTARELILLQKRVWQYSPDLVVLLVTTGNDIRDNSRKLSIYGETPLPYFTFQDGKLALDDSLLASRNRPLAFRLRQSFAGSLVNWMRDHVRVIGLVYAAREAFDSRSQSPARPKTQGDDIPWANELGMDSEVFREPANSDWKDAWQVTEGLIMLMRDEVRAKGAKFLVVTGSRGIQVSPNLEVRQEYMTRSGLNSLFYPDQRLKALGDREGFPVLNLAPALADYAAANKVFLHGVGETVGIGHWNETGHRLAGQLISRGICENGNLR